MLEAMQEIAISNGGLCLSAEYKNTDSKLLWQCKEGHQWQSTPYRIKNGAWCAICRKKSNGEKRRTKISFYKELAKQKQGKCISENVSNAHEKLLWECDEGHQWYAEGNSMKNGTWCPKCSSKERGIKSRNSIEEVNKVAIKRGGQCLSKSYTNAHVKLDWKCSNNHKWKATYHDVQQGNWCPICSQGFGERVCREFFEKIFKTSFIKTYPDWLLTPNKNQMELDGYSELLKIAFEHQGSQHYKLVKRFYNEEEFLKRKEYDKLKRDLCYANDVKLIEIPEIPTLTKVNKLQDLIINLCVQKDIEIPKEALEKKIEITHAYSPDINEHLNRLKDIATKKGGQCLSTEYLGMKIKLLFKCSCGYEWKAMPYSILSGTWCPKCANVEAGLNRRLKLDDIKDYAKAKGGKCLSESYTNSGNKLLWQCEKGHEWEATQENVMHKNNPTWCPKCQGYGKTIDDMKNIANERGGDCLSNEFLGVKHHLLWQCKEGHKWKATPDNVINNKRWCPVCAIVNRRKKSTYV